MRHLLVSLARLAVVLTSTWVMLACWLCEQRAWAATEVLLLVTSDGSHDPGEYELRLRSELRTEGVVALSVDAANRQLDRKRLVERSGASGVVEVSLRDDAAEVAVWLTDPNTGPYLARSVTISLRENDPMSVLALRTVDLYLGANLELEQQRSLRQDGGNADGRGGDLRPVEPAATTKPAAERQDLRDGPAPAVAPGPKRESADRPRPVDVTPQPFIERLRVGGGISIIQFSDQLERRISAYAELVASLSANWRLGTTVTGPYLATLFVNSPTQAGGVETTSVDIDQEFFWLDGRYRIRLRGQFEIEPSLGVGLSRYGVSAEDSETLVGNDVQRFSGIGTLGGTVVWRVAPHVRLSAAVVGLLRLQTPKVLVAGDDVTGTSATNLWGSLGLAWAF